MWATTSIFSRARVTTSAPRPQLRLGSAAGSSDRAPQDGSRLDSVGPATHAPRRVCEPRPVSAAEARCGAVTIRGRCYAGSLLTFARRPIRAQGELVLRLVVDPMRGGPAIFLRPPDGFHELP